jgi:hypothetical protein
MVELTDKKFSIFGFVWFCLAVFGFNGYNLVTFYIQRAGVNKQASCGCAFTIPVPYAIPVIKLLLVLAAIAAQSATNQATMANIAARYISGFQAIPSEKRRRSLTR